MILCWLGVAFAGSSFHPGPGSELIPVDSDGRVNGWARTGEVLVHTTDPAAIASLPQVASVRKLRGEVVRVLPAPGVDDIDLANLLHERPDVGWAHPNFWVVLHDAGLPNDPYLPAEWHLENTGQLGYTPGVDIGASEAWEITHGAGQIVAIVFRRCCGGSSPMRERACCEAAPSTTTRATCARPPASNTISTCASIRMAFGSRGTVERGRRERRTSRLTWAP